MNEVEFFRRFICYNSQYQIFFFFRNTFSGLGDIWRYNTSDLIIFELLLRHSAIMCTYFVGCHIFS